MPRVLGIDLGTTNSCVAVVESDTPLVVPVDQGKYTLPSVIAVAEDGRHLTGRLAKRQAVINAEQTIFAAKRLIGRAFDDPLTQRAIRSVPYSCERGPQGDVRIRVKDRTYAVQEILALQLKELRDAAVNYFNEPINNAVVTVPAYFNDKQRQAVKDAARIAGLELLRIINEPTAAALAYGVLQAAGERIVAVYDLGGGTFDVSILHIEDGTVEVIATAGDAFLGGRDFDDRVLESLLSKLERDHGVPLSNDRNAVQRLREAAETAKIELSDKNSVEVALPFLSANRDGKPIHLQTTLERKSYESMVADLIDRTIQMFEQTFTDAGLNVTAINEVILVGGMTRTPNIQQRVARAFGRQPSSGVHPDLVVAVGAAIQGSMLVGDTADYILLDVTPHNLGIMTLGGMAETIIGKDTTIPTEAKKIFTTVRDNQSQVKIVVFQGESRKIVDNELLGEFVLSELRPAPRGAVQVEVSFAISADGLVTVAAKDVETGREQTIQVTGSHRLEEDEIRRMIAEHNDEMLATVDQAIDSVASA
ncbi:MAG: molecular chaperone DnaK [Myxococcota bacterium]